MPRPKRVPSYRLHKPSGQARVILDGEHIYLGPYGAPESREKYARLIAERFRLPPVAAEADRHGQGDGPGRYPDMPVNELLLRYLRFAEGYYVRDGRPTGEVGNIGDAMRPLRALYGSANAREFGPRALKLVREHMINVEDLSRRVVNDRVDRIKRIFKWAVSEELVPPSVYEGLRAVAGLRYGRCAARETEPVRPVADEWVEATLKFLPPQVADMVRLQRVTGMRSDNVVTMRPCNLDRGGNVWVYEPAQHKTKHHGKRLQILIGPQGQAVLKPYRDDRPPHAFIFSPREVEGWRAEQRRLKPRERKTPVYPCELRRLRRAEEARRRRKRKRPPGECYTTDSYRRAVQYAIGKANEAGVRVPDWYPHQLRHSKASEVRKRFGIEGAQLALGHAKLSVTEIYAERDLDFAKRIARKTG